MFQHIDEASYLHEMATLISMAKRTMLDVHADAMIYTISVWTDPDAAVSAVSFDTIENSQARKLARPLLPLRRT